MFCSPAETNTIPQQVAGTAFIKAQLNVSKARSAIQN